MNDLRGQSVRGGVVTMAAQGFKFFLNLGAIAILARELTPADFGVVAMVVALTAFLSRFKDFGLSTASVQRADISFDQLTGLFWANALIGFALFVLVLLSSPVLVWLYAEPKLGLVAIVLSTTFLISGLGVQHAAILRRRFRFTSIAVVEILAIVFSTVIGVAAAMQGAGYWALVAMPVVNSLVTTVGSWWASGWRPGRPDRRVEITSFLQFGGRLSLVSLMNSTARSVDGLIVGLRWGAEPLGLYSKAMQLSLIVVEQLNTAVARVAIPVLSSLQNQPELFRGYYRRGIQLVALVHVPIAVGFFVFADGLVEFVLGDQWEQAGTLFRYLAPAALFEGLRAATSWVYISLANSKQHLRWAVFSAFVRVGCILVGSAWGPEGVAIGYSLGIGILWIPGVLYCFSTSPVEVPDLSGVLWRPIMGALAAGGISWWLFVSADFQQGFLNLPFVMELATFGLIYVVVSLLLPGGLRSALDVLSLRGELTRRSQSSQDAAS